MDTIDRSSEGIQVWSLNVGGGSSAPLVKRKTVQTGFQKISFVKLYTGPGSAKSLWKWRLVSFANGFLHKARVLENKIEMAATTMSIWMGSWTLRDPKAFAQWIKEEPEVWDGELPFIWRDRPWHPQTRQEIYSLICVSKRLGLELPRLALETIAFWIQLIELQKEFKTGCLRLEAAKGLLTNNNARFLSIFENKEGSVALQTAVYALESTTDYDFFVRRSKVDRGLPNYFWDILEDTYPTDKGLKNYLDRKDRFRIVLPNRAKLDSLLSKIE